MVHAATRPERSALKASCNSETAAGCQQYGTSTPESWGRVPQGWDR